MVSGYVREDTKHDATTYTLGGFYKLTPKIKACTVVFQFYQLSDSFRLKTASSFGRNARIASSFTITLISKIASKFNKANS